MPEPLPTAASVASTGKPRRRVREEIGPSGVWRSISPILLLRPVVGGGATSLCCPMGGRRTPPFLSYGDLREERRLLGMDRIAPPLLGAPVLSPTCRSLSASCRSGIAQ